MSGQNLRRAALPLLLLTFFGLYFAGNSLLQNVQFTQAQTEVSFWGREAYVPTREAIARTSQTIESLLQNSPAHPGYLSLQANSYAWQSYWAQDERTAAHYAELAQINQGMALQSRPVHTLSQAKMVEYTTRLQGLNN